MINMNFKMSFTQNDFNVSAKTIDDANALIKCFGVPLSTSTAHADAHYSRTKRKFVKLSEMHPFHLTNVVKQSFEGKASKEEARAALAVLQRHLSS